MTMTLAHTAAPRSPRGLDVERGKCTYTKRFLSPSTLGVLEVVMAALTIRRNRLEVLYGIWIETMRL